VGGALDRGAGAQQIGLERLPSQPDASPLDGVGFRALLGRALPRLIERLGDDAWPGHVQDELYAAVACGDPEEGFL